MIDISGGTGAILIQNDGMADSLLYTYSDAQGSLIALTDADGNLVRKFAYDPWGKRRDTDNWNVKDNGVNLIVNRGYTGHEHLDAFGIINMNGRVYDPLTAQFFSPDPDLQAPGDWLNYNRYGYCMGNPFRYTDPSGYSWMSNIFSAIAGIGITLSVGIATGGLGLVAAAMIGGASGGLWSGAMATAYNGGSFSDCASAGLKGMLVGGVAGLAGGGAAQGVTSMIGSKIGGFAAGALIGGAGGAAGGFAGGAVGGWLNGASLEDGLMAGLKGAGIGAVAGGLIGGTIKGIDAAVNGKANFWDGHVNLDLSKGYAATNLKGLVLGKTLRATYKGMFHDARMYESSLLGNVSNSGGVTLPMDIVVGEGVYNSTTDFCLGVKQHEYGHILQYKLLGSIDALYYNIIGIPSLESATLEGLSNSCFEWNHNHFWTEEWANTLSKNYFGSAYIVVQTIQHYHNSLFYQFGKWY